MCIAVNLIKEVHYIIIHIFLYFYHFFYKKMLHTRAIVYQRSYFCTSLCPWARPSIRLSILVSISAIQVCTGNYLLKLLSHILVMVMPQMYLNQREYFLILKFFASNFIFNNKSLIFFTFLLQIHNRQQKVYHITYPLDLFMVLILDDSVVYA